MVTLNKWSYISIDWNLCTILLFGFTTLSLIMMNSLLLKWQNYIHFGSRVFLPLAWFWQVRSLLSMLHVACCLLLGYSFEPWLSGRAGSVVIIGLSIKRCLHLENQFDETEQDWLVQKWELCRLKTLNMIPREGTPWQGWWKNFLGFEIFDFRIFLGRKILASIFWVAWFK